MNRFEKSKINYLEATVDNYGTVYRQCLKMTAEDFDFIKEKIIEKLAGKIEYGDHTMLPQVGKNSDTVFSTNLSTARFIKSLLPENLQKRFLMDRNTYIKLI